MFDMCMMLYHYLITGNGFIEGTELDSFFREFISSVNTTDCGPEVSSAIQFLKGVQHIRMLNKLR